MKLLEKLNRISIYYNYKNSSNSRANVNIPHNINFPLEKNRIVVTARPEGSPFNGTAPEAKKITFKKSSSSIGISKAGSNLVDTFNSANPDADDKISRLKKLGFSI